MYIYTQYTYNQNEKKNRPDKNRDRFVCNIICFTIAWHRRARCRIYK